ncbi:MAG: GspMb/PilO family protein [Verrucomicrobiia bacterium]|tara:strand:- start:16517 stop:17053 length:537 start_codon:yes stop_codon:yes gene_type:complete
MKAWFISRVAREKLLLLLFAVAAAVLWVSGLWERGRSVVVDVRETRSVLDTQKQWLSAKSRIEKEAADAVANLDGSRTFNRLRLSAELSTLAKEAGIDQNLRSEAQPTQQTAQFSIHTVSLTLSRVHWENNLLPFYAELSKRAPYISIESFSLGSVRNNPAELNARLTVSSVEIAESP